MTSYPSVVDVVGVCLIILFLLLGGGGGGGWSTREGAYDAAAL